MEVDGRRFAIGLWVPDGSAQPRRPSASTLPDGSGSGEVVAPMQGTIVEVLVEAGEAIQAGEAVCVLEAMKMENHVGAEKSGTVTEVRISPGDLVGAGDVLAIIK